MDNYSKVYLREEKRKIIVRRDIDKPTLPSVIINKWQRLIDLMSIILKVPASLIMHMSDKNMEVYLTSNTEGNPYPPDGKDSLGHGLYCETVIGTNKLLEVHDSLTNEHWKDNPDVKLNMISYLGFPIKWPDGSFFGTICSLDSKPRNYNTSLKELMETFKNIIEEDLQNELLRQELIKENKILDYNLREIHHRIKNNFNVILNYIQIKEFMGSESNDFLIKEIENRVKAVSLLHEKLYKSLSLKADTKTYLTELFHLIVSTLTVNKINLNINIGNLDLNDQLLEYGVILMELITNSFKYAFKTIKNPEISMTLKNEDKKILFIYKDNGPGIDSDYNEGFGSILFKSFAEKNRGLFTIEGNPRNIFKFTLELPNN